VQCAERGRPTTGMQSEYLLVVCVSERRTLFLGMWVRGRGPAALKLVKFMVATTAFIVRCRHSRIDIVTLTSGDDSIMREVKVAG
jgi:hypothetical protein